MGQDRADLGAMLHRLTRALIAEELPLLARHDLEMWDYAVLSGLASGPAATQSQLAAAVGRDKTRLIPILDRLEASGLVLRTPDPADRRNRVVALTDAGRSQLSACRAAIRAMEREVLRDLPATERQAFLKTLERLVASVDGRSE